MGDFLALIPIAATVALIVAVVVTVPEGAGLHRLPHRTRRTPRRQAHQEGDHPMTYQPTYADRLRLAALFAECAEAGYGIYENGRFEAYPGMYDAAADFIESRLGA